MFHLLVKLLKVLNSEDSPAQIAWAICFAAVLGLTPLLSLHNIIILFLVMFLRVNLSAFILFSFLFAGVAYLLDPLFHSLGYQVLNTNALNGLWTALYNTSIGRLSSFNNTLVMGSLVVAMLAWIPLYFIALSGIAHYRRKFLPWVKKSHLMGVLKTSKFYRIYESLS